MTETAAAPIGQPSPAQAAQGEIASLRAGRDPGFLAAYGDPQHIGHRAAVDRMTKLHETAYAADAAGVEAEAGQTAAPTDADYKFELAFGEEVAPEAMATAHQAAAEAAAALQLPPDMAAGAVRLLEGNIASRQGRPMDGVELATMESQLRGMWGEANYDARMDAVEARLAKMKPGARNWLRRSMLAAGPAGAAWVFASLANEVGAQ